jgi:hypothetical protein
MKPSVYCRRGRGRAGDVFVCRWRARRGHDRPLSLVAPPHQDDRRYPDDPQDVQSGCLRPGAPRRGWFAVGVPARIGVKRRNSEKIFARASRSRLNDTANQEFRR